MKIINFIALVSALIAATSAVPCTKPCPRNYMPVCGYNGEEYKVFSNQCVFENEHCKDGLDWVKASLENCGFGNYIKTHAAKIYDVCIKPCPRIYLPVCGFDGNNYKLFNNKCIMQNQRCQDKNEWLEASLDKCKQKEENHKIVRRAVRPNKQCPVNCPAVFSPICGYDGTEYKLFQNYCEYQNANCDVKKWEHVSNFRCMF